MFHHLYLLFFWMTLACTNPPELTKLPQELFSTHLNRVVTYTLYLPQQLEHPALATLLLNDGQDAEVLKLEATLKRHLERLPDKPLAVVAIHANEFRLVEYGTSQIPDYKNRGNKATEYEKFVMTELIPTIKKQFATLCSPQRTYFAGFSLGGLSAFDIAWHNPQQFRRAGVFSGSFWWRSKAFEEGYDDYNDRIMHVKVRNSPKREGMSFWFQCGTKDETSDRNNNGIIDSIEDTQDLIQELRQKGYQNTDLAYVEIIEGEHNYQTWSKVFPQFLDWLLQ